MAPPNFEEGPPMSTNEVWLALSDQEKQVVGRHLISYRGSDVENYLTSAVRLTYDLNPRRVTFAPVELDARVPNVSFATPESIAQGTRAEGSQEKVAADEQNKKPGPSKAAVRSDDDVGKIRETSTKRSASVNINGDESGQTVNTGVQSSAHLLCSTSSRSPTDGQTTATASDLARRSSPESACASGPPNKMATLGVFGTHPLSLQSAVDRTEGDVRFGSSLVPNPASANSAAGDTSESTRAPSGRNTAALAIKEYCAPAAKSLYGSSSSEVTSSRFNHATSKPVNSLSENSSVASHSTMGHIDTPAINEPLGRIDASKEIEAGKIRKSKHDSSVPSPKHGFTARIIGQSVHTSGATGGNDSNNVGGLSRTSTSTDGGCGDGGTSSLFGQRLPAIGTDEQLAKSSSTGGELSPKLSSEADRVDRSCIISPGGVVFGSSSSSRGFGSFGIACGPGTGPNPGTDGGITFHPSSTSINPAPKTQSISSSSLFCSQSESGDRGSDTKLTCTTLGAGKRRTDEIESADTTTKKARTTGSALFVSNEASPAVATAEPSSGVPVAPAQDINVRASELGDKPSATNPTGTDTSGVPSAASISSSVARSPVKGNSSMVGMSAPTTTRTKVTENTISQETSGVQSFKSNTELQNTRASPLPEPSKTNVSEMSSSWGFAHVNTATAGTLVASTPDPFSVVHPTSPFSSDNAKVAAPADPAELAPDSTRDHFVDYSQTEPNGEISRFMNNHFLNDFKNFSPKEARLADYQRGQRWGSFPNLDLQSQSISAQFGQQAATFTQPGQAASQPASSGFSFGDSPVSFASQSTQQSATPTPAPQPTSSGFGFGGSTGFFGSQSTPQSANLIPAPQTTSSGFGFGGSPVPQPASSGFGFGISTGFFGSQSTQQSVAPVPTLVRCRFCMELYDPLTNVQKKCVRHSMFRMEKPDELGAYRCRCCGRSRLSLGCKTTIHHAS